MIVNLNLVTFCSLFLSVALVADLAVMWETASMETPSALYGVCFQFNSFFITFFSPFFWVIYHGYSFFPILGNINGLPLLFTSTGCVAHFHTNLCDSLRADDLTLLSVQVTDTKCLLGLMQCTLCSSSRSA